MDFLKFSSLNKEDLFLVEKAFKSAENSISDKGHKVGCAILDANGNIHVGATNVRSRVIGSTCAERMAMDSVWFKKQTPKICVLVGKFNRSGWSDDLICTPCGVCLEMFFESINDFGLEDLPFICAAWDRSRILKINLSELYPQIGKTSRK
ncbi:MAG: hypothetical protein WCX77_02665 [Candidatus Paceibacterota bacterium]|jgi:cytidine deaminase